MKRIHSTRRPRRELHRTIQAFALRRTSTRRLDGRVALAVLWALGRLAQRLGPA